MRGLALALAVLFTFVPSASADDPFYDPLCTPDSTCVGPGSCTAAGCVPRSCQPVAYCTGTVISADDCATNLTIEGETCQGVVGVGGRTNTPGQEAWIAASLTDGHVDAFNLPNTWTSPSVQAGLKAGGIDFGVLHVGVYQSRIDQGDHEWTSVALVVAQGEGLTGGEAAMVTIRFLDGSPEGCAAQTSRQTVFTCPTQGDVREILP